jgi:hypothetical protein
MKTLFFSSLFYFLLLSVYTQNLIPEIENIHEVVNSTELKIRKKIANEYYWYEDFANGLSGNNSSATETWTTGSTTNHANVWKHDKDGPKGSYSSNLPFGSESSANGWMIFDANLQTDNTNYGGFITIEAYLESPVIDLSGLHTTSVGLEFNHNYRTCCASNVFPVNISVGYYNGSNWIWTDKNTGNNVHNKSVGQVQDSKHTPEVKTINIVDVVKNAKNSGNNLIKIRFHWNKAKNSSNSYYYWMIDDVRIVELFDYDSELLTIYSGDIINSYEYYSIPQIQFTNNIVVGGTFKNVGGENITNTIKTVSVLEDITGLEVHESSSLGYNLTPGQENAIWHNTNFIPSDVGRYTIKSTVSQNEIDQNIENNSKSKKINVTEYEWGHYTPNNSEGTVITSGLYSGAALSFYEIEEDATIYGMYVYIKDSPSRQNTIGQFVTVSIVDFQSSTTFKQETFSLNSNLINNVISIRFSTPLVVAAGESYQAKIEGYGGGNYLIIAADYDGDEDNSTLIIQDDQVYGANYDPYLHLSFDPNIATTGVCSTPPSIPTLSSTSTLISCESVVNIEVIAGSLNSANRWYIYEGSCSGISLAYSTSGNFTLRPDKTTTYYVRGEGGGCIGSCAQITINVQDNVAPVPNISSLPSINSDCGIEYIWELDVPKATDNCDGEIFATINQKLPFYQNTTINWTYKDKSGNTTSQTQSVLFNNASINTSVTKSGNSLISEESNPNAKYQWIDCSNNVIVSYDNGREFSPLKSGNYKVRIYVDGCGFESDCTNIILGSNDSIKNPIKLYPNPATNKINIELTNLVPNTTININDVTGKIAKSVNVTSNKTVIDVADLSTGIYIVKIKNDNGFNSLKFIKE